MQGAGMSQLSHAELLERLSYDEASGEFRSRITGRKAGCKRDRGYVQVKIDGVAHRAHRLAWFYVHGEWPAGQIDHLNGNRADNRIANLRECDNSVNRQNLRGAQKNNITGLLGVQVAGKRFRAQIGINGAKVKLGVFDDPQEAHEAYMRAKREMHPGCTI